MAFKLEARPVEPGAQPTLYDQHLAVESQPPAAPTGGDREGGVKQSRR